MHNAKAGKEIVHSKEGSDLTGHGTGRKKKGLLDRVSDILPKLITCGEERFKRRRDRGPTFSNAVGKALSRNRKNSVSEKTPRQVTRSRHRRKKRDRVRSVPSKKGSRRLEEKRKGKTTPSCSAEE